MPEIGALGIKVAILCTKGEDQKQLLGGGGNKAGPFKGESVLEGRNGMEAGKAFYKRKSRDRQAVS